MEIELAGGLVHFPAENTHDRLQCLIHIATGSTTQRCPAQQIARIPPCLIECDLAGIVQRHKPRENRHQFTGRKKYRRGFHAGLRQTVDLHFAFRIRGETEPKWMLLAVICDADDGLGPPTLTIRQSSQRIRRKHSHDFGSQLLLQVRLRQFGIINRIMHNRRA